MSWIPLAGDVGNGSIELKAGSQAGMNTFTWRLVSNINSLLAEEVAELIYSYLIFRLKDLLADSTNIIGVAIRRWFPELGKAVVYSQSTPGELEVETLPKQVSALVSFATAWPGRGASGRLYVPFPPVTFSEGSLGRLTAAAKTAVSLYGAQFVGPALLDGEDLIVEFGLWKPGFYPFTSHSVADGFATQRRRGFFGRPNP